MARRVIVPGMFKSLISPVQAWLLIQNRCVGCGRDLSESKALIHKLGEKITCVCGRIFIRETKSKKLRRALLTEV